jgi:acetolactate synthase-1/2/3 large subunit
MKVADYIIARLAREGIDTVFLVQGAANADLIDAFNRVEGIRYVCPMHEQAAGFAAEGWAKVTGLPGCAIATSGPGGQNLVTPIANCYYDSVPAIFITGQVNSRFMAQTPDVRQVGFQEWPAAQVLAPITKMSVLITDPETVPFHLESALRLCVEGRPGPVHLDIPIDVQRGQCADVPVTFPGTRTPGLDALVKATNAELIAELIEDLRKAKRPILLVGGGAYKARDQVRLLAEQIGIPAIPTWNALDIISADCPMYGGQVGTYGGAGRNFAVQNCDLLLALGSRISGRITGGNIQSFARGAKRYYVEIDQALADPRNQQLPAHESICADVAAVATALLTNHAAQPYRASHEWLDLVLAWRDKYDPVASKYEGQQLNPYTFARELSGHVAENAIIVGDCGGNIVALNHGFKTKRGQRYITNNGNSPMGFSLAGAIGAWFADPSRQVICVIGDGGMMLNVQELQTVANYNIPLKIFVINNEIYGISRAFQHTHFEGRLNTTGPDGYKPASFDRIAFGFEIAHKVVRNAHSIALILEADCPVLAELHCPGFCDYTPAIRGWNTPIEDMYPLLPREEFRSNMIIDPLPGWETGEY